MSRLILLVYNAALYFFAAYVLKKKTDTNIESGAFRRVRVPTHQ